VVAGQLPVSADTEPNNDFGSAESVSVGTHTGNLTGADTADFYSISIGDGQDLIVNLTLPPKETMIVGGDMNFVIFSDSQVNKISKRVTPVNGQEKTEEISWTVNSEKDTYTYYIRVDNQVSGTAGEGNYTLGIRTVKQNEAGVSDNDAGDTSANADGLTTGIFEGFLKDDDTDDYYEIDVGAGQTLYANLTVPAASEQIVEGGLKIEIMRDTGQKVVEQQVDSKATAQTTGYIMWTSNSEESSWTYRIHVSNTVVGTGGQGGYSLEVMTSRQHDGGINDNDAGDSLGVSTDVLQGTYGGFLNDDDRNDYYGFGLEAGQGLFVNLTVPVQDDQLTPGGLRFEIIGPDEETRTEMQVDPPATGDPVTGYLRWYENSSSDFYPYTILVTNIGVIGNFGECTYTLEVGIAAQGEAGKINHDAGDDKNSADLVAPDVYNGLLADTDTYDWYKVELDPGQTLYANVTLAEESKLWTAGDIRTGIVNSVGTLKMNMRLASNNTASTGSISWTTNSSSVSYLYFIYVTNFIPGSGVGAEGPYILDVGVENQNEAGKTNHDAGDKYNTGSKIGADIYNGLLKDDDKNDFYYTEVPPEWNLSVNLTLPPRANMVKVGGIKIEIFDENGHSLKTKTVQPDISGDETVGNVEITAPKITGNTTFIVRVTNDVAGGPGEGRYLLEIDVYMPLMDVPLPEIFVISPEMDAIVSYEDIEVRGTTSSERDIIAVELSPDNLTYIPALGIYDWNGSLTLTEGEHVIYIRAVDDLGNIGYEEIPITVDLTIPTVSITTPAQGQKIKTSPVEVSGTSSDTVGIRKVEWSRDNASWQMCTGTLSWTTMVNLEKGSNTIIVRATDLAGNTAYQEIEVKKVKKEDDAFPGFESGILVLAIIAVLGILRARRKNH
jgi:hypothetical protein